MKAMVQGDALRLKNEILRLVERRRENKAKLYDQVGFPPIMKEVAHNSYTVGALDALVLVGALTRAEANEIMVEVME